MLYIRQEGRGKGKEAWGGLHVTRTYNADHPRHSRTDLIALAPHMNSPTLRSSLLKAPIPPKRFAHHRPEHTPVDRLGADTKRCRPRPHHPPCIPQRAIVTVLAEQAASHGITTAAKLRRASGPEFARADTFQKGVVSRAFPFGQRRPV